MVNVNVCKSGKSIPAGYPYNATFKQFKDYLHVWWPDIKTVGTHIRRLQTIKPVDQDSRWFMYCRKYNLVSLTLGVDGGSKQSYCRVVLSTLDDYAIVIMLWGPEVEIPERELTRRERKQSPKKKKPLEDHVSREDLYQFWNDALTYISEQKVLNKYAFEKQIMALNPKTLNESY